MVSIMPAVLYEESKNNLVCLLVIMMIISLVLLGCIQASTLHCLLLITGFVIISQMTQLAVDVCVRPQTMIHKFR